MQSLAQKKAQENFKKAINYRTKTGCSLKEAFAHVKGKKVGVVKKRSSSPLKKKATKKAATKKPTLKYRGTLKAQDGKKMYKYSLGATKDTRHKDTKSHNVNIRVVSGIGKDLIEQRNQLEKLINSRNGDLLQYIDIYKTPNVRSDLKIQSKKIIANIKDQIKTLKLHLKEINQLIAKSK